jgi:hypothetical protein
VTAVICKKKKDAHPSHSARVTLKEIRTMLDTIVAILMVLIALFAFPALIVYTMETIDRGDF